MMLFPSLTLVAALLTFVDVSNAQFYQPPYVYPQPELTLFPPSQVKGTANWVLPLLGGFDWNKLMNEAHFKNQLDKVLAEVKNMTHNGAVSPAKFQQLALNHEDIYNFMHHFAEILRYHPNWKVMVHPYIQQHHLSPKYLELFEQMMLFFLLHNFPGHHNVNPNFPPIFPPQQPQPYYPPYDMMPFQPYFPTTNWMDGYGNSPFDVPYYAPMNDPNHPLPPLPNMIPGMASGMGPGMASGMGLGMASGMGLGMTSGMGPGMPFNYPPFPVQPWKNFPQNFPSAITLGGNSNCAEMVNVTFKLKIYDEITCTTSIYAPRQCLNNFLAIAAQKNKCFKFKTERRPSRTSGKEGEYLVSMNTIDATNVSKWAVHSRRTRDPDLNTYKPVNGEVIMLTFNLIGKSKNKR